MPEIFIITLAMLGPLFLLGIVILTTKTRDESWKDHLLGPWYDFKRLFAKTLYFKTEGGDLLDMIMTCARKHKTTRAVPACETSKALAKIAHRKGFTLDDLFAIEELGLKIKIDQGYGFISLSHAFGGSF